MPGLWPTALDDERRDGGHAGSEQRPEACVHEVGRGEDVRHPLAAGEGVDGREAAPSRAGIEVVDAAALVDHEAEALGDLTDQAAREWHGDLGRGRSRRRRALAAHDQRQQRRDGVGEQRPERRVHEVGRVEDVRDPLALVEHVQRGGVAAPRAGHEVVDAPALEDDEAEADADRPAQAARRRAGLDHLGEVHAVDARAAAVRRGHGDRHLLHPVEVDLVAVGLSVRVGRADGHGRAVLRGHGRDRRRRDTCSRDTLVLPACGVERAEVDPAQGERGEAGIDGVGHVVGVDLAVVRVGDVHDVTVGPDAAGAVVADAARLRELLGRDALELDDLIGGLRARFRQAVGEEPFRAVVGDPDRDAVRPDAVRVVVRIVEGVLGEEISVRDVVGEEDFASGKGCNRIATELNAEGVPTLGGNQWYPVTITRILKNETYTGRTVYRRTKKVKVRRPGTTRRVERHIEQDPSQHIVIEGASPQIVSRDLFDRVQARFGDPERLAKRAPPHSYPLRGRLRCGHCWAGMVGQSVQRGRYFHYRCNRLYLRDAGKRCSSRQVRKEALETAVLHAIEGVLADPELAVGMAERLQEGTDHAARLAELAGAIRHLDESQDRLVDLYTDGEMTKDAYQQKQERLARRKAALEREQAQLRSECEPGPDPELLQALDVRVDVSPEEADVRVEVPMVGAEEGTDFVTIEQTSASPLACHNRRFGAPAVPPDLRAEAEGRQASVARNGH